MKIFFKRHYIHYFKLSNRQFFLAGNDVIMSANEPEFGKQIWRFDDLKNGRKFHSPEISKKAWRAWQLNVLGVLRFKDDVRRGRGRFRVCQKWCNLNCK